MASLRQLLCNGGSGAAGHGCLVVLLSLLPTACSTAKTDVSAESPASATPLLVAASAGPSPNETAPSVTNQPSTEVSPSAGPSASAANPRKPILRPKARELTEGDVVGGVLLGS